MKKIDFQTKKTEFEWQQAFDRFWLEFTPKWFNWLGWVLIIGAITYLSEKTNNAYLNITKTLSTFALFFYFQGFFYSFEFHGIPFVKSNKIRRTISIVISGFLTYAVYVFLTKLVVEVKG